LVYLINFNCGSRTTGELLFFACAKKSNQKKAHPPVPRDISASTPALGALALRVGILASAQRRLLPAGAPSGFFPNTGVLSARSKGAQRQKQKNEWFVASFARS
jgi:hypothetical protein